jgi:cullin 3
MSQAFESFMNQHPRASEFISLYIDENLKKGLKGVRWTIRLSRQDLMAE